MTALASLAGAEEDDTKHAGAMLDAPAKKALTGSLGAAAAVGAVKHHGTACRVYTGCRISAGSALTTACYQARARPKP